MVFEFNTPGIARLAASAGAEFVVFDQEHSGFGTDTIRWLMAASKGVDIVPLVRVPATEYHLVARVMDVGAMGIMVPMVESADQARRIVDAVKYIPLGKRGTAFSVAHDDFLPGDVSAKMRQANDESMVICQIETARGVEEAERIAGVEGVDCLWIGHYDLTQSLGIPGQFDHASYLEAERRVLAACAAHGKAAGFMVADLEGARRKLELGFRAIAYFGDVWLYQRALAEGVRGVRALLEGRG